MIISHRNIRNIGPNIQLKLVDYSPTLPTIFDYNKERCIAVNNAYKAKLEARNRVPCLMRPDEGEFVPEYKADLIQKRLNGLVDELPAAKIPSRFMETLVGFINFFDKKYRIYYRQYQLKSDYKIVMDMISSEAMEHYPEETYRYYLQNWPDLCYLAFIEDHYPVGVIIGQRVGRTHGYIAYTFVIKTYRRKKIASTLVKILSNRMHKIGIREVTTEVDSENASGLLEFYKMMNFSLDRFLMYYYRNGTSAWKLKKWIYEQEIDEDRYMREVREKIAEFKLNPPPRPEPITTKGNKNSPKSKSKSKSSPKKGSKKK